MTKLLGTNIPSYISPYDSADKYPTHKAIYGQGGVRTVELQYGDYIAPIAKRSAGTIAISAGSHLDLSEL